MKQLDKIVEFEEINIIQEFLSELRKIKGGRK